MDDKELWEMAKARVGFRSHLYTYLIVNALLWIFWIIGNWWEHEPKWSFPWPIYPLVGWGIGLFFHYRGSFTKHDIDIRKEFDKLKQSHKE